MTQKKSNPKGSSIPMQPSVAHGKAPRPANSVTNAIGDSKAVIDYAAKGIGGETPKPPKPKK